VTALLIVAMLARTPPAGVFNVQLVRGSVHASIGSRIDVVAHRSAIASDPEQIIIVMKETHDGIDLYAQYPRYRELEMRECLPPLDERGDFYHHDGRVDLEITLPPGWTLNVEVLADD
jgi:hypothetical protein